MRKGMATVALAAGFVIGAGGFTAAHAESFWHAFGGVRIGGIHFTMGYHSPPRHRRYPGRYYRTKHQLKHRGYKCGRLCYRRGGYYNHHESCGLLGAHMSYHGYPVPYYPQYERATGITTTTTTTTIATTIAAVIVSVTIAVIVTACGGAGAKVREVSGACASYV